jgi:uncharacterized protein (TIGR00730 family)
MNVCVFCGSASGLNPIYASAAETLAILLCKNNCTLVYGGGNVGLMGVLADTMILHGGKVIGIIPEFLMKREVGHKGISQLEVVQSMHERKKRMADLTDAFVALPGGMGTMDELAEILTWKQLGLITSKVGILNVNGYFDPLLLQMNTMVEEGFLRKENFDELKSSSNPSSLLTLLGVLTI